MGLSKGKPWPLSLISKRRVPAPLNPSSSPQTCVLKVFIHCAGCKNEVQRVLSKIQGVSNIDVDSPLNKVTILSTVGPDTLIRKLRKSNKVAELWPVEAPPNDPKTVTNSSLSINNGDDKNKEAAKPEKIPSLSGKIASGHGGRKKMDKIRVKVHSVGENSASAADTKAVSSSRPAMVKVHSVLQPLLHSVQSTLNILVVSLTTRLSLPRSSSNWAAVTILNSQCALRTGTSFYGCKISGSTKLNQILFLCCIFVVGMLAFLVGATL